MTSDCAGRALGLLSDREQAGAALFKFSVGLRLFLPRCLAVQPAGSLGRQLPRRRVALGAGTPIVQHLSYRDG